MLGVKGWIKISLTFVGIIGNPSASPSQQTNMHREPKWATPERSRRKTTDALHKHTYTPLWKKIYFPPTPDLALKLDCARPNRITQSPSPQVAQHSCARAKLIQTIGRPTLRLICMRGKLKMDNGPLTEWRGGLLRGGPSMSFFWHLSVFLASFFFLHFAGVAESHCYLLMFCFKQTLE